MSNVGKKVSPSLSNSLSHSGAKSLQLLVESQREKKRKEKQQNRIHNAIAQTNLEQIEQGKIVGLAKKDAVFMFARWRRPKEIRLMLAEEHGIDVCVATVRKFGYRHVEEIEAERERYLSDFTDTPLAHRKERVLELMAIFQKAKGDLESKEKGQDAKKRGKSYYYAIEALKNIREEMEPIEPYLSKGTMDEVNELLDSVARRPMPKGDEDGGEE